MKRYQFAARPQKADLFQIAVLKVSLVQMTGVETRVQQITVVKGKLRRLGTVKVALDHIRAGELNSLKRTAGEYAVSEA